MRRRGILALGVLLVLLAPATDVHARSTLTIPYEFADVWPAAVRFLRIDRGFPIREKDESSGYILFDLLEGSKSYKGSLELVRTADNDGRESVQLVMTVPDLPRHYEALLLDKLALKVRDERGSPAAPPPRRPPVAPAGRPKPDAGDGLPRAPTMPDLPR